MNRRTNLVRLIVLLLLLLMPLASIPVRAAEPGAELLNFSGTLSPAVLTRTTQIAANGPVNLRLSVSGGSASDTITLTLRDSGSTELRSWIVRSGETVWGFADVPSGSSLRLQNNSAATLNFALTAYARGTVQNIAEGIATWQGTALGDGASSTNSAIQLVVPTAGLYRFTLEASQGSFQIVVNSNYIRKTVVSGSQPDPADTTYYLSAGTNTFSIIQNPTAAAVTAWSVQLTAVGGTDGLPSPESSAQLGGGLGGGAFVEEWIPLQLAAAQAVNINIAVTGASTNSLSIELYNGSTPVYTSMTIYGGEVVWGSSELAAGANALRVVTGGGNSAPLAYSITISTLAQPSFTWSGSSYGTNPGNSTIRLTFPSDGLYRFTMAASSGRYQFRLADGYIAKIVTAAGTDSTAFVPAGTYNLVIDQDSTTNTSWSVTIAAAGAASDTLPYTRSGTTLGGSGNDFNQEWLPIHIQADTPVNIKVSAQGGSASDSLYIELYNGFGQPPVLSAPTVYRDEVFWATANLRAGINLVRIVANGGNTGAMDYQIEVSGVNDIPTAWSGVSLGGGLNSAVRVNAPVDGVYNIVLTITVGAGQLQINNPALAQALRNAELDSSTLTLRVPLQAGPHVFVFQQDTGQPRTEWQIAASLRSTEATLAISSITPNNVAAGNETVVTIEGNGFQSNTTVELLDASNNVVPSNSVIVSSTQIRLTIPSTTPSGTYTLRLSNGDGQVITRPGAITIGDTKVYLALILR